MDPSGCHTENKLKQDKGRIRTSEEPPQLSRWEVAVAQTRDSRGGGEKQVDPGPILKAEPQDLWMDWMWGGREREEP